MTNTNTIARANPTHLLTADRETLLQPLQTVANIVEKRQSMLILLNVLLEKSGRQLTLTATDIEIQVRTTLEHDWQGEDSVITVAAKKLYDIVRALPEKSQVKIELEAPPAEAADGLPPLPADGEEAADNSGRMLIRAGRSRFTLQTLPADGYPKMSFELTDNVQRLNIRQRAFKAQLAQVAYAMATQDIRYYLNGLLLVGEGSTLSAVTTDGHRLAYASSTLEAPLEAPCEIILPRKTIQELMRQLSDSDDLLEIAASDKQASFRFSSIEIVSKLIDGKFPDYQRVIPKNHPHCLVLERTHLLAALQRAAILTSDKLRGVRLVLAGNSLKIFTSNNEHEEAQEEIELPDQSQTLDIGFNVSYLLEVLQHLEAENIECHFHDNNSSVLITIPDNEHFKYVVMPMRI